MAKILITITYSIIGYIFYSNMFMKITSQTAHGTRYVFEWSFEIVTVTARWMGGWVGGSMDGWMGGWVDG